jgi:hypothetical protein
VFAALVSPHGGGTIDSFVRNATSTAAALGQPPAGYGAALFPTWAYRQICRVASADPNTQWQQVGRANSVHLGSL